MAATSFAVPSAEEMRTILCVSCRSDWLLMLSRDSRLGAIGRAAWATCSWVRRIARDAGMISSESSLELENDCLISDASGKEVAGGTGGRKGVVLGAEVEKVELGSEKGKEVVGSKSG